MFSVNPGSWGLRSDRHERCGDRPAGQSKADPRTKPLRQVCSACDVQLPQQQHYWSAQIHQRPAAAAAQPPDRWVLLVHTFTHSGRGASFPAVREHAGSSRAGREGSYVMLMQEAVQENLGMRGFLASQCMKPLAVRQIQALAVSSGKSILQKLKTYS